MSVANKFKIEIRKFETLPPRGGVGEPHPFSTLHAGEMFALSIPEDDKDNAFSKKLSAQATTNGSKLNRVFRVRTFEDELDGEVKVGVFCTEDESATLAEIVAARSAESNDDGNSEGDENNSGESNG